MLTKEDIKELYEATVVGKNYNGSPREDEAWNLIRDECSFEVNGITIKPIYSHGGGEGDGEERWIVFSTEKDAITQFWRVDGFYASHYGSEFDKDTVYETEQQEQVIKVWAVKK